MVVAADGRVVAAGQHERAAEDRCATKTQDKTKCVSHFKSPIVETIAANSGSRDKLVSPELGDELDDVAHGLLTTHLVVRDDVVCRRA